MGWFSDTTIRVAGIVRPVPSHTAWGLAALIGLWALAAGPAPAGGPGPDVSVTDVSFAGRSDGQGYVMRLQTTAPPEAYMLKTVDPHTLKWVVYNATLHERYEESPPRGPVQRYTTTQNHGHLVLRVDLKEQYSVSAVAYRDGASDDLLLNLTYDGASVPAADASSASSSAPSSASESETGATAPSPSDAGELIADATRRRSRLDTVVIDPGHGGKDPGAVANGLLEKDIVLDVAHQLGEYIENRLDLEVVYTRTDDRFIALEERGHMANRKGGDLFISLHANAFRSSSVYGTETYFLGRTKTDAARRVMRKENSVVREYENNPERYDEYDAEAFVKGELFLSANMQFSEELAALVQDQFKTRVHRRSRGVHQAGFYVLWSASMPSVLVELGYLTNPREARFLNSDRGQVYLASAIFRAVRKYKNDVYNKGIVSSE